MYCYRQKKRIKTTKKKQKTTPPPVPEGLGLSRNMKLEGVIDRRKLSVSHRQKWVSMKQKKSRSCDVTILTRSGPMFLTDLALSTPSIRGPGLKNTSPSRGPRWQKGNTLSSHLRGSVHGSTSSGKAGSCLPLVSSLQYRTLTNCL